MPVFLFPPLPPDAMQTSDEGTVNNTGGGLQRGVGGGGDVLCAVRVRESEGNGAGGVRGSEGSLSLNAASAACCLLLELAACWAGSCVLRRPSPVVPAQVVRRSIESHSRYDDDGKRKSWHALSHEKRGNVRGRRRRELNSPRHSRQGRAQ